MASIWCKTSNCKILHLIFQIFSGYQWQKLREKLLFGKFCVSIPLPVLNKVEKQRAKVGSSYVMVLQHCVGGDKRF